MDLCSYVHKNTLLTSKGGGICTPLTPLKSTTVHKTLQWVLYAHCDVINHFHHATQILAYSTYSVNGNKPSFYPLWQSGVTGWSWLSIVSLHINIHKQLHSFHVLQVTATPLVKKLAGQLEQCLVPCFTLISWIPQWALTKSYLQLTLAQTYSSLHTLFHTIVAVLHGMFQC